MPEAGILDASVVIDLPGINDDQLRLQRAEATFDARPFDIAAARS